MADFETWEALGTNAYGTVYRGVQFSLKREVAILQLDPALRKEAERSPRFWDEITAVAALTDDRLVPVYAVDRGQGWIVMELMAGHCGQLLTKPLDPEAARSVLRQGLSGLERLQEQQRTHGDIRPQTLLLNRAGRVKLSFSVGSAVAGGLPYQKRQMKYVAPEAVSPSFGEYGPAADLYSLGFSVLELLIGPKFDGLFPGVDGNEQTARTAWMRWHAGDATKLPSVAELASGAPLELVMVLDRLLKKPTAERYASATEALKDLSQTPLVPIVAPELGITGAAAGGAALVTDVDRIFDPASKYDTATATGDPRTKSPANNTTAPQPAAPGKSGSAKSTTNEKQKKNRKALVVGAILAAAVIGIFFLPGDEQPAEAPVVETPKPPAAQKNQAPTFALKPETLKGVVDEGVAWTLKLEPKDAETKAENLKLTLADAPAGMRLDAKSNMLSWTPTEQHGPGKFTFRVRAEDDAVPPLAEEKTFELAVTEVNVAPTIKPVSPVRVKVGAPINLKLEATDDDLPAQKLAFSVPSDSSLPEGAKLDAITGELTWIPTSDIAGTTTKFTVVAADDGKPALSARTEVVVNVTAENKPPVIAKIPDRTIDLPLENTAEPALRFGVKATDPDAVEGAKLKYALVAPAPAGASLDESTGLFAFAPNIPADLKLPPTKVTVEVVDNGSPPAKAQATFTITFQKVDLLARLRERLNKAGQIKDITDVVAEGRKLQNVSYIDQIGLRRLLADAYIKRGDAYLALPDYGSALVDFNTVVKELDVAHIDARLGRAFSYGRQGDWRTAAQEYDDILALDENNTSALRNRATARYELKQFAEAVADCDRAVAAESGNPAVYFVRANAKLALKKQGEALTDFRQATALFLAQPNAPKAMLVQCLEKQLEIMKADPSLNDPASTANNQRLLAELKAAAAKTAGN